MNLISNTCLGAFIQRDWLKQSYENPFCWNVIDFKSMLYLITNYETINYNNFEIQKDKNWNFSIIVDNAVKIQYVHYKFDAKCETIKTRGVDVYWNKIWQYIVEKYKERTKRMLVSNNKPLFIIGSIHNWQNHVYSEDEILKICEICSRKGYKCIISNRNFDFSNEHPNIKFNITQLSPNNCNYPLAKEIYKRFKEYINDKAL